MFTHSQYFCSRWCFVFSTCFLSRLFVCFAQSEGSRMDCGDFPERQDGLARHTVDKIRMKYLNGIAYRLACLQHRLQHQLQHSLQHSLPIAQPMAQFGLSQANIASKAFRIVDYSQGYSVDYSIAYTQILALNYAVKLFSSYDKQYEFTNNILRRD